MTPFVSDPDLTLYVGDCLDVLRSLPDGCVDACVTSPPYWGLRDYGTGSWDGGDPDCDHLNHPVAASGNLGAAGVTSPKTTTPMRGGVCTRCGATRVDRQLGLEASPAEYVAAIVAVFAEVRRVLADHGTLWLNLGDSYAGGAGGRGDVGREIPRSDGTTGQPSAKHDGERIPNAVPDGVKPKNLVGIPWKVAQALQAPRYTGRITEECDRVWLAATLDAEGTICGFDHTRSDDGSHRSGVHITITNTSERLLDEAARIWPTSRSEHQRAYAGHLGTKTSWRWIVHGIDNKLAALRDLYPYLIVKREQAVVAYSLLLLMKDAKRLGHSPQKDAVLAKRRVLTALLSDLNHGRQVDLPNWLTEPPTLCEPGWYLRSDIIWAKPNPMPESVTDRPTKAHEYVFLLSKGPRYFFDQEAVREPAQDRPQPLPEDKVVSPNATAWLNNAYARGASGYGHNPAGRNVRSVWQIATQPYADAHFATFPEELPRRCILAGCPDWVCGTCGKARERLTERTNESTYEARRDGGKGWDDHLNVGARSQQAPRGTGVTSYLPPRESATLGWSDCGHNNYRPGTVLDPFFGSGTTGLVARKHGRRTIGIELNPEYARMAARRLQQLSLLA